jgi:GntR family transcriptional regulator/MocR family aminotransferase
VISVYDQLSAEGFILGRPGACPCVVDVPQTAAPKAAKERPALRRLISARGQLMVGQPSAGHPGHGSFSPGMPDAETFPFATWSRLLARQAKAARLDGAGCQDLTGYPPLQRAIADYIRVSRQVRCHPGQIVITTDAQAALDLLARVLLDPGDAVWVEEPGHIGAQAAFGAAGARMLPLAVGDEGWRLDPPPPQSPRLIYVTPACQHPLGATMQMEQRLRLIDMANRMDALIIEDDFDSEYRFRGRPAPALQGADTSQRVIYVGTFAKLLFPALRLGFMVLPEVLLPDMARALTITGQCAPLLLQAALADFIEEGHMSLHLTRTRKIYALRRDAFQRLADHELPDLLTLRPSDAGLQCVANLRAGVDDVAVALAARRRGLHIAPLSLHYRYSHPAPGLVLGYAAIHEAGMPLAFRSLKQALSEAMPAEPAIHSQGQLKSAQPERIAK